MQKQFQWLLQKPIAHRGAYGEDIPENSLAAFKKAVELNLPVELDVRLTKDNELIVFHDFFLRRMTGARGRVKNSDWKYLNNLYLKNTQNRIPKFSEVLDAVGGKVGVLVELKVSGDCEVLCEKVLNELSNYRGDVAFISFSMAALKYISLNSDYPVGLSAMNYKRLGLFGKRCVFKDFTPDFLCYYLKHIPSKDTVLFKNLSRPVISWTAKDEKQYRKAKEVCDNAITEIKYLSEDFFKSFKD